MALTVSLSLLVFCLVLTLKIPSGVTGASVLLFRVYQFCPVFSGAPLYASDLT